MLIRIVKMTFREDKVQDFIIIFKESKNKIAAFEGCLGVELLRDIEQPNTFFTYSRWRSDADLQRYRSSQLFQSTWAKTKPLFSDKPQAWSLEECEKKI